MTRRGRAAQRGMSAVLVLVLLVLFGGMLAHGVNLIAVSGDGLAREIQRHRVEAAAQAGLDWGRFRLRTGAAPLCTPVATIAVPMSTGNVPVTVGCVATGVHLVGATPVRTWRITAAACWPAGPAGCPNPAGGADHVLVQAAVAAERSN